MIPEIETLNILTGIRESLYSILGILSERDARDIVDPTTIILNSDAVREARNGMTQGDAGVIE